MSSVRKPTAHKDSPKYIIYIYLVVFPPCFKMLEQGLYLGELFLSKIIGIIYLIGMPFYCCY